MERVKQRRGALFFFRTPVFEKCDTVWQQIFLLIGTGHTRFFNGQFIFEVYNPFWLGMNIITTKGIK